MNRENVLLFAVSLAIAIVLFFQVQPIYTPNRQLQLSVALRTTDPPARLIVTSIPSSVDVLAEGSPADLNNIETTALEAIADLENVPLGRSEVEIELVAPQMQSVRFSLKSPRVVVTTSTIAERTVPVLAAETGTLPELYSYGGATTQPREVSIRGPEDEVANVARAKVTLDLSQVGPRSTFRLPVELVDEKGLPVPLVTAEPKEVVVSPAIGPAPASALAVINARVEGTPAVGFEIGEITLIPNQLRVRGEPSAIARLRPLETQPISVRGLRSDTTLAVRVILPPGITAEGSSTVQARITIVPVAATPPPADPSPTLPGSDEKRGPT